MAFDFAAVLHILPEFIVSGIVAFLFYTEFKKPFLISAGKPKFVLFREHTYSNPLVNSLRSLRSEYGTSDNSSFYKARSKSLLEMLGSSQMILLTVNLWILFALVLLPRSSLTRILPTFPLSTEILVYGLLALVFTVSLTATVISRLNATKLNLVILLASGAVISYFAFYLPPLQFVTYYSVIIQIVIVYCVLAVSVFGIYSLYSLFKRKDVVRLAIFGTYISYAFTAVILVVKLLQTII